MARSTSRERIGLSEIVVLSLVLTTSLLVVRGEAVAQAPFLSYDFDDGKLDDFIVPINGGDLCGDAIPSGPVEVVEGEVVMTNDDQGLGISIFGLLPDVVQANFPDSRDYKLRVRLRFGENQVTQFQVYLRARLGVDVAAQTFDSSAERGYSFSVIPELILLGKGALALTEFESCHDDIGHTEWPGAAANGVDFALVEPEFEIVPDEEYWLEVASQGDDDKGPIVLTAKLWVDGDDPPEVPQLIAVDTDGLNLDAATRDPKAEGQVLFGTNFDIEPRPPGATFTLDDLTLSELSGCAEPPALVTRKLDEWEGTANAEGEEVALYEPEVDYEVVLEIGDVRGAGDCDAAGTLVILENVPAGFTVKDDTVTGGGTVDGNTIRWEVNPTSVSEVSYLVTSGLGGNVTFGGQTGEVQSDYYFFIGGAQSAVPVEGIAAISDFGSIQHWLILGPFEGAVPEANPGEDEIRRDYLTDGDLAQDTIRPAAGDTIEPDFGGDSASVRLVPNGRGRNPGDVATWIEWLDLDDDDDRIDFETVYGGLNNVMCHAVTYLNVDDEVTVNFGVSSDDAVQILLDGDELHLNAVARGALGREYQDNPVTHENLKDVVLSEGQHTLLVKVFEGGGEHNFRVGFVDEFGAEIPGGPEEITISLTPEEKPSGGFRRGDTDGSGLVDISDPIFNLTFQFVGGVDLVCEDAADVDDSGVVDISDPIYSLTFQFVGGIPPPPAPGEKECGADPTEDERSCEDYPQDKC